MEMSKLEASIFDAYVGTSFGKESDMHDLVTYITGNRQWSVNNRKNYKSTLNKELLTLLDDVINNVKKGNSTLTEEDLAILMIHTGCTLGIEAMAFPKVLVNYNVPHNSNYYWGISEEYTEIVKEQTLDIFNNVKVF